MRHRFVLLLAVILAPVLSTPGRAFECAAKGPDIASKRAVCTSPRLVGLNKSERARLLSLNGRLKRAADRALVRVDRGRFERARDVCGTNKRCLEAAYKAQIGLYDRLDICAVRGGPAAKCLNRATARHRRELGR